MNKALHGEADPYELAMRKHFAMLLESKIRFFADGDPKKAYHAWLDPLPFRYRRSGEAALKVVNATLKQRLKIGALHSLRERDSKLTPGIQVADFLLGAVMSDWQQDSSSSAKLEVRDEIARYLGWGDLFADTRHREWKFNIWAFFDPTEGRPRQICTREVKHLIPTPPLPRHR